MRRNPLRSNAPFRVLGLIVPFTGLVLLAAACGSNSSASRSTTSNAPVTIHLGYLTNLTHASALVGARDGYFTKELPKNATLQSATFNAGPAEVTALLSGSLDVAYLGPSSAITAFSQSQGKGIQIISGATSGGAALVVNDTITTANQLKGKTLATPQLGNTQDVALRTWLKSQRITFTDPNGGSGDVNILPQQNSTTLTAFESGSIAGAWVPEPWATRLAAEGHGHVLVNEKSLWPKGQFSTTVLVVTSNFLKSHADLVNDLLKGQVATNSYLNSSPVRAQADANDALATITGKALNPAELTASWSELKFTDDPIAASIAADVKDAAAVGFPTTKITGLYDFGPLNQLLHTDGQPQVSTS